MPFRIADVTADDDPVPAIPKTHRGEALGCAPGDRRRRRGPAVSVILRHEHPGRIGSPGGDPAESVGACDQAQAAGGEPALALLGRRQAILRDRRPGNTAIRRGQDGQVAVHLVAIDCAAVGIPEV